MSTYKNEQSHDEMPVHNENKAVGYSHEKGKKEHEAMHKTEATHHEKHSKEHLHKVAHKTIDGRHHEHHKMAHKMAGVKHTGTFEGKSNRLGGGGRFAQVEARAAKSGAKNPAAVAAVAGRRALGNAKFQALAAKGRARANRKG